jgi:hypothetical protein
MRRRRRRRPAGRGGPGERSFDAREHARKCVGLRAWKAHHQFAESFAQQRSSRLERLLPGRRQREGLAAAVLLHRAALDQSGVKRPASN